MFDFLCFISDFSLSQWITNTFDSIIENALPWVMGHMGHGSSTQWVTWVMDHSKWPIAYPGRTYSGKIDFSTQKVDAFIIYVSLLMFINWANKDACLLALIQPTKIIHIHICEYLYRAECRQRGSLVPRCSNIGSFFFNLRALYLVYKFGSGRTNWTDGRTCANFGRGLKASVDRRYAPYG